MIVYGLLAVALASRTGAIELSHLYEKRNVACPAFTASVTAQAVAPSVSSYCYSYLGMTTRTSTVTTATATVNVVTTLPSLVTVTASIVPAGVTVTKVLPVTVSSIVTAPTKTVTVLTTQTAYLDDVGNTLAIMRKRAEPTAAAVLEARAVALPAILASYNRADRSAACSCMALPRPTITRTIKVKATSTVTQYQPRTIRQTTVLAPILSTLTGFVSKTVTVYAAAPLSTVIDQVLQYSNQCPPTMPAVFQCPEGTGDDESTDPSYAMCPVTTSDGFQGDCIYWLDDGSPAGSLLLMGDGSGDPNLDTYRDATYGSSDQDDCPSFADYLCNNSGVVATAHSRRVRRTRQGLIDHARRDGRKSPPKSSKDITSHKTAPKAKIPYPPPARGGRMRGFTNPDALTTRPVGTVVKTLPLSTAKATSVPKTTSKAKTTSKPKTTARQ